MFSKYQGRPALPSRSVQVPPLRHRGDRCRAQGTSGGPKTMCRPNGEAHGATCPKSEGRASACRQGEEAPRSVWARSSWNLHKALLDNLNLAALENASDRTLRAEISSTPTRRWEDMASSSTGRRRQQPQPGPLLRRSRASARWSRCSRTTNQRHPDQRPATRSSSNAGAS